MKIIRDDKGKIIQIVKEESDGDFNIETILKIEADEKIAIEKEITEREREITAREKEITLRTREKCNFFMECSSIAAKAIIAGIDEYNHQQQIGNYNGLNASEDGC